MWEAIESNRRRSWVLISAMGVLLILLGYTTGMVIDPDHGGLVGTLFAVILWTVLMVLAFVGGDHVLLMSAGARKIEKDDSPRLWNIVEEMTIASGLGRMPAVYIVEDSIPNAFAVGRKPERAAVAVTSGLLSRLDRDELQGVIAHEVAHIVNRDVAFMTLAGVMVGAIVIVADVFLRHLWYGGGRRRTSSSKGGHPWMFVAVIAFAILAPVFARLLYFACSRRREYLADASGAMYSRYPEGLASALEKISSHASGSKDQCQALAPLYIVNPLQAFGAPGLFSTHPPTQKRVRILRAMCGGAGYADYESAYQSVMGTGERCIGLRTMASSKKKVPIREATREAEPKKEAVDRAREAVDILDRLGGMLLMACPCGVRIKLPPESKRETIDCPRCGHTNTPGAARTGATPVAAAVAAQVAVQPLSYTRQGNGWESFKCGCGRVINLSPSHVSPTVRCRGCRSTIVIEGVPEPVT